MKVLIYTDDKSIRDELAFIEKISPCLQRIHDSFRTIGVRLDIIQIQELMQVYGFNNIEALNNRVKFIVSDYLLGIAGTATLNGVAINRDKMRDLIELPSLSDVVDLIISEKTNTWGFHHNYWIRPELFSYIDDTFSLVKDYKAKIEAIYSYYTNTDSQAKMCIGLQAIIRSVNECYELQDKLGVWRDKSINPFEKIAGIERLSSGQFVVDKHWLSSK